MSIREVFENNKSNKEKENYLKSILEEMNEHIDFVNLLTPESKFATPRDFEVSKQIISDLKEQMRFTLGLNEETLLFALKVFLKKYKGE